MTLVTLMAAGGDSIDPNEKLHMYAASFAAGVFLAESFLMSSWLIRGPVRLRTRLAVSVLGVAFSSFMVVYVLGTAGWHVIPIFLNLYLFGLLVIPVSQLFLGWRVEWQDRANADSIRLKHQFRVWDYLVWTVILGVLLMQIRVRGLPPTGLTYFATYSLLSAAVGAIFLRGVLGNRRRTWLLIGAVSGVVVTLGETVALAPHLPAGLGELWLLSALGGLNSGIIAATLFASGSLYLLGLRLHPVASLGEALTPASMVQR